MNNFLTAYKLKTSQLRWWHALAGIIVFFGVGAIVMILVGMFADGDENRAKETASIFGPIQPLLMFIVGLVVIRISREKLYSHEDAGFVKPTKQELGYGVAVALIFSVITWVAVWLSPELNDAGKTVASNQNMGVTIWQDLLFVFAAAVAAPLGEEIIFRGLIFRGVYDNIIRKNIKKRAVLAFIIAALISSVLFAVTHIGEGQEKQMVYIVLFGILVAWLYWKTKSLYVPILAHSVNNMIFALSVASSAKSIVHPVVYVFALTTPFIALAIMVLMHKIFQAR